MSAIRASIMQEGRMSVAEHAMRSVIIGNIPYDVTEDQMKEIISEVGAIIVFRYFHDESGKFTGFAFCEYKDIAIAHSALRNLNGLEIKGQPLRVDSAASEKGKEILRSMQRSSSDMQYEESDSTTEKAPEEISKAVASLPAEQMFELMKQMKLCIENNPQEARNLLLQNPQLAYALLQAQVIMRIVDPQVALKILNRPDVPPTSSSEDKPATETVMQPTPSISESATAFPTVEPSAVPPPINPMTLMPRPLPVPMARSTLPTERPPVIPSSSVGLVGSFGDQDHRALGDRDLRLHPIDRDMRSLPMLSGDKDMRQIVGDQDLRTMGGMPDNRPFDPRFRGSVMSRAPQGVATEKTRPPNVDPRTAYEGQNIPAPVRVEDPRKAAMTNTRVPPPAVLNIGPSVASLDSARQIMHPGANPNAPHDQEKAALIMQVLQLTDQQIASLPPEQRQSIIVLKDQIARSHAT